VRIGLQRKLGTSFHFWKSDRSLEVLNERAMELLDTVGLEDIRRLRDGGTALRAQARAGDRHHAGARPEMMLLDEPTAGHGARGRRAHHG
jgi:branched-chain amino acid transport system ATP-binding protein